MENYPQIIPFTPSYLEHCLIEDKQSYLEFNCLHVRSFLQVACLNRNLFHSVCS